MSVQQYIIYIRNIIVGMNTIGYTNYRHWNTFNKPNEKGEAVSNGEQPSWITTI
jgi:hypothetical protein